MPIKDRKFYIAKHNGLIDEENKKKHGNSVGGEQINAYANLYQMNDRNSKMH